MEAANSDHNIQHGTRREREEECHHTAADVQHLQLTSRVKYIENLTHTASQKQLKIRAKTSPMSS